MASKAKKTVEESTTSTELLETMTRLLESQASMLQQQDEERERIREERESEKAGMARGLPWTVPSCTFLSQV